MFVDVGNSYVKWQTLEGSVKSCTALNALVLPSAFMQDCQESDEIYISCGQLNASYFKKLQSVLPDSVLIEWLSQPPEPNAFQIGYASRVNFGIDRYLSLLGIRDVSPAIVVDLGTAITVDVMVSSDRHLGGWIIPSLNEVESYFVSRFQMKDEFEAGVVDELGSSTQRGISNGYLSMLVHFLNDFQHRPMFSNSRFFVTGGGAFYIHSQLDDCWEYRQNMVLQGLKIYVQQKLN